MALSSLIQTFFGFAALVKRRRESKGWSLEKLAERIGLDHSSISAWENEEAFPREANAEALADVLADPDIPGDREYIFALWRLEKTIREGGQLVSVNVLKNTAALLETITEHCTAAEPGKDRTRIVRTAMLNKLQKQAEKLTTSLQEEDIEMPEKKEKKTEKK